MVKTAGAYLVSIRSYSKKSGEHGILNPTAIRFQTVSSDDYNLHEMPMSIRWMTSVLSSKLLFDIL